MTSRSTFLRRCAAAFAAAATAAVALASPEATDALPPAIQALQKQGATIVGTFPSVSGLKAYAAIAGGQPLPLYVSPDGHHVIAGMALDDAGENADEAPLRQAVAASAGDTWKRLESSHWIADGRSSAPRIVYVFTDPNCPYCARLWADARPWVDAGQVQIRHVIIGVLAPTSAAKAAALLSDKDPAGRFARYEAARARSLGKNVPGMPPGAKPDDLLASGATPASAQAASWVEANDQLMASLGLFATPGVVWRDAGGAVQKHAGVAPGSMAEVFGPR